MAFELTLFPFEQVRQFSDRDRAYTLADPRLTPFYKYPVKLETFREVIEEKKKQPVDRALLVEVLKEQYTAYDTSEATLENIHKLADSNTYTVITAHQPSLFTGPLYYIYKIGSAIKLANRLNEAYPNHHFVPVFISGGEDHDFEEVNHLHLFGKTLTWENAESGPVGRMSTETLKPVVEELKEWMGNSDFAVQILAKLEKSYLKFSSYGQASLAFVNELFKQTGLVTLSMDDARLKRAFIPIMKKEITEQASQSFIQEAQAALEKLGFSGQAFPREINLFYMGPQFRERLEWREDHYQVLNQEIRFSKTELLEELEQYPERFSPNVIMRPLYQESILPNLAYIGGGGELAYWLERLKQFEYFKVPFPMLIRRNSALILDKGNQKRLEKLELNLEDLFMDTEDLIKRFVKRQSDEPLNLNEEKAALEELINRAVLKAERIDPTLVPKVKAEGANQLNSLEKLEGRLMKAEKQKHEVALNQIRTLKEKLFPNNGLQERYDNFLNFYLKYGEAWFQQLYETLDPLENQLFVYQDIR